jgi:hypothetical protein
LHDDCEDAEIIDYAIECPVNNETSHIALVRIRFHSVITISCLFPFIVQNWKNALQPSAILRTFLNGGTGKVTMDVKQKQRAVIEFLLVEG